LVALAKKLDAGQLLQVLPERVTCFDAVLMGSVLPHFI